jgi:thiamine pyrophosphokinase
MIQDLNYKSVLCLNGNLPDKEFFDTKVPIIAADGAADQLLAMNIYPDVIVGDLDSIQDKTKWDKSKIIYAPDPNLSDFQKSLHYIEQQKLSPSIIVGINGGFMDHILFNIDIIMRSGSIFFAPPIIGIPLKKKAAFQIQLRTKISIFGMPEARISTVGLEWELEDDLLKFPGFNSLSNFNIKENVEVNIKEGAVLIMLHTNFPALVK